MEKEDVLNALEAYLKKDGHPYLYGSLDKLNGVDLKDFKGLVSEAWRTGGVGGGSCWDEGDSGDGEYQDPHYELGEEDSEPIKALEKFLEQFYPHLSISQYKEIMMHVQTEYWTDYEYYGNHTNYACHYITFESIANTLVNLKKPTTTKIYR